MWSSLLPTFAVYLSLSIASPIPQAPAPAPTRASTQAPTQSPTQAPTVQAPTVQAPPATSSGSSINSRYMVTHAEISQRQGDVIPSHNTTATIIQTIEKFDIVVQGTTPGALPVQCNATWIATMATPTNDPVGTQFSCSDPAVSALMLRKDSDPSIGWWIMVELNNKMPEMWMQKDLAAEGSWTLTSTGMWVFNGKAYSGPMPTQSLAQYLGHAPASG